MRHRYTAKSITVFLIVLATGFGFSAPLAMAESSATLEMHVSIKKPEPVLGIEINPATFDLSGLELGSQTEFGVQMLNKGNVPESVFVSIPSPISQDIIEPWHLGDKQGHNLYTLGFRVSPAVTYTQIVEYDKPIRAGNMALGDANYCNFDFGAPTDVDISQQSLRVIFTVEMDTTCEKCYPGPV